ncbi:hypothetical protein KDN24_06890 [Bacillus sp. Bva_UNVM-123]|uniref:hypothetical protein n=1 Tax=Bacillus sp. Bva_UNVM-123 TaxID=2829798 RepID=UPI00391FA772
MIEYDVYVNNVLNGSIKTLDIEQFIKENYKHFKSLKYRIDYDEKEVYLFIDIMNIMKQALNK